MAVRRFAWAVAGVMAVTLLTAGMTAAQDAPVLEGTEWQLVSWGPADSQSPVMEDTTVTLSFFDAESAGGSAGCNNWGAGYTVDGDTITFSMPFSTMMACMEPEGLMEQEQAFLAAISTASTFAVDGTQLTITTADGQLLVFSEISPLIGTGWLLTSIGGADVVEGSTVTLTFGSDGRAYGTSGCNRFFSGYTVDGEALTFTGAGSTMMMCAEEGVMEQETAFLAALGGASSFTLEDGMLTISGAEGDLMFSQLSVLATTSWTLTSILSGGEETVPVDGAPVTLMFGVEDDAYGSAGCNNYRTSISVNENEISFGMVMSTRMMCEEAVMAVENAFTNLLSDAAYFNVTEDMLTITTADFTTLTFSAGAGGM